MTDRAWGLTLGAIALRRHTGQLSIESDGKRYAIAFADGAIVGAASPLAGDALARIALTGQLITAPQVGELARRIAAAPERDEVDVLAEAVGSAPDQLLKLRHRMIAQRAARTFALEHGAFVLGDRITLPVTPGVAIDHRHVVYLGARTHLSEQRRIDDLRQLGAYFVLRPEAIDELPRFGFEPGAELASAQIVIDALAAGTSLPELEAAHRELDPRFAQAVIYALVSCNACVISPRTATTSGVPAAALPAQAAISTQVAPPAATQPPPAAQPAAQAIPTKIPTSTRTRPMPAPLRPPATYATRGTGPVRNDPRTVTSPFASGGRTSPTAYASVTSDDAGTNTPAATRSRTQSNQGQPTPPPDGGRPPSSPSPLADRPPARVPSSTDSPVGAGVPSSVPAAGTGRTEVATGPGLPPGMAPAWPSASAPDATPGPNAVAVPPSTGRTETEDIIRFNDIPTPSPLPAGAKSGATFGLPRVLTPSDSELARGFTDQRTPTPGFGPAGFGDQRTPSDPALARTPTGPATSRVSTDLAVTAEAAFKRGEQAMKRDQPGEAILEFKVAYDLNPGDVDYAGMLAWAKFCAAGDKAAVGGETRKILERAVFKSQRPERARFYLGRVERMLGRDKEAMRQFQEVLELKPNHAEAASEIRAIEVRLAAAKATGLFGRKR